jgi:hypothetical protein
MKGWIVAIALVASTSCAAALKHPAVTAGAVGFTLGFTTCEVDAEEVGKCSLVGGGAALFLGGITALVTYLTDAPEPVTEGEVIEDTTPVRSFQHHRDAGIDAAPDGPNDGSEVRLGEPGPDAAEAK